MKKLTLSDIRPRALYEPIRDDMRRRAIETKRTRRLHVGDIVTIVFENRTTMIFQIEEMVRAEKLDDPAKIQEEIDVYNSILSDGNELTATLFIEVTEQAQIRPTLNRLVGLDEHVSLRVGEHSVRAHFEAGRSEEDRISSVQYLRFPLPPAAQAALRTAGTPLALVIDHPHYAHTLALSEETRAALAADLDS